MKANQDYATETESQSQSGSDGGSSYKTEDNESEVERTYAQRKRGRPLITSNDAADEKTGKNLSKKIDVRFN
jgi:hypothetical protein